MTNGLFLGKFLPPHNGHLFVCDVARRHVDELTIFICSYDAEPIDGYLRARWLQDCVRGNNCDVVHMHRDIPQEPADHPDFWNIWKAAVFEHQPEPIDFVFGSETYIYKLAKTLGAKPFVVDQERQIVPTSGTSIRSQPESNWAYIPPPVRSHFQNRITLLGPESTGKSTLSSLLADHFDTLAVPEYGRDYDAIFKKGENWSAEDFLAIANGHAALAEAIAENAGPVLFEDTDLLQTIVWAEALLSEAPQALVDRLKDACLPDLYLLLSPEVDWIDDGTRYYPEDRQRRWFFERLKHWLGKSGVEWREVSGSTWTGRENNAIEIVTSWLPGNRKAV